MTSNTTPVIDLRMFLEEIEANEIDIFRKNNTQPDIKGVSVAHAHAHCAN